MSELYNVGEGEIILVDFDGVLVDTQTEVDRIFREVANCEISPEWNDYLANDMDWDTLLRNAKIIGNGFDVLKELLEEKRKTYILTRTFSDREIQSKTAFADSLGFPAKLVLNCPGRKPKEECVFPNKDRILVEDSIENAMSWKKNTGTEILFRPDKEYVDQIMQIKKGLTEYDEQRIEAFVKANNLDRLTRKEELKEFRKYLIALGDVRRLNQISSMQDITYTSEEINFTNDLSTLTKIRK